MSQQVRNYIKQISGMEYVDTLDAERLVVRQENQNDIVFEFWDYEGKRGEMAITVKVAVVLSRSILLCMEGSLGEIRVNL